MKQADGAVVVFARVPEPGAVKTRLIPELGPDGAADLYRRLLLRTIAIVDACDSPAKILCVSPGPAHPEIETLVDSSRWALLQQGDGDLGQRMNKVINGLLGEYEHVIVVGSDLLDLQVEDLNSAHEALSGKADIVLGPCDDGGYYLIGLGQPAPELFTNMHWGTSTVCVETMARIERIGMRLIMLPQRRDVDRPEDLYDIVQ